MSAMTATAASGEPSISHSASATFVDASPGEGLHRYTVTAVDRAGNESTASNAADARTP